MNNLIKKVFVGAAIACALPSAAYADFTVTNNTDFFATADAHNAKTDYQSPCSSTVPFDGGIMKPHSPMSIPTGMLFLLCNPSCDVSVYMTKNCSGEKIAIIPVFADATIGQPVNMPNANAFYINRKGDTAVSIEKG